MRAAALLGANLLMLVAGLGVLPLLGVARSWRALVQRSALAYFSGILLAGIVSADLALVHVSFGWIGLAALAALGLGLCFWRLRGTDRPGLAPRPAVHDVVALAALLAVFVDYARAFRVAPLNDDAWAIWALKGHASTPSAGPIPSSSPAPPTTSRISTTRCCCRR